MPRNFTRAQDEWRWLRKDIGWSRRKALRWLWTAVRRHR